VRERDGRKGGREKGKKETSNLRISAPFVLSLTFRIADTPYPYFLISLTFYPVLGPAVFSFIVSKTTKIKSMG
jgi:hypothetical protein